jgi:hypothetical protein
MMGKRPPKIPVSASFPGDDDQARKLLEEALKNAAKKSHVNVSINIFNNPGRVYVYDQSETDSPKTTLLEGTEVMSEKTEIHADKSVVSYKSRLDNVQITLEASRSEGVEVNEDVQQAIKEFSAKLKDITEEHSQELELLSLRLEEVAKQVAKPTEQRKPGLAMMSAKGLVDAAKAVGDVVPGLIKTAETISGKVTAWLG